MKLDDVKELITFCEGKNVSLVKVDGVEIHVRKPEVVHPTPLKDLSVEDIREELTARLEADHYRSAD